jgi:acetyl-CoA C-acetyltransferase
VTKHSFGIYSTTPVRGAWQRESPSLLQTQLDALPTCPVVEHAAGAATIETYTVMHNKVGPDYSVLFGRLRQNGARFLANTAADPQVLADLQQRDSWGGRARCIIMPAEHFCSRRLSPQNKRSEPGSEC